MLAFEYKERKQKSQVFFWCRVNEEGRQKMEKVEAYSFSKFEKLSRRAISLLQAGGVAAGVVLRCPQCGEN
jgi:hypothetical protein